MKKSLSDMGGSFQKEIIYENCYRLRTYGEYCRQEKP